MRRKLLPVLLGMVLAVALTGCGESVEHKVQRAQIALTNNKPDIALQLADAVLKQQPDHIDAMLIKAQAQVRQLQLEPAYATFEAALTRQADNPKARRMLVAWTYARLSSLLDQSDFVVNPDRQRAFDQALTVGQTQAEWLRVHEKTDIESEYVRARLLLLDADRLRQMLIAEKRKPKVEEAPRPGQTPAPDVAANLERDMQQRMTEATRRLKAVVAGDPRQFEAADRYLALLMQGQDWPEVMVLSRRLAQEKDLPPGLAGRVVLAVLQLPDAVETPAKILELGRQIQDHVEPGRRNNSDWRLAEARLLIKAGDPSKALPALDAVLKDDARNTTARYLKAQCLYAQRDYPGTRDLLKDMIPEVKNQPSEGIVQMLYGGALLELKDLLGAREALRRAIDVNEAYGLKDPLAYQLFLRAQSESNLLDQTGAVVDSFYQKNPADPRAIRFKMNYEQVRGRRDVVQDLLTRVERLNPLTDDHLQILVEGYQFLRRFDLAQRYAQQLVARRPDNLDFHLRLAQAMLMQNQDEAVRQMLGDLRKKFPNASGVDQMLADLYLGRGSYDKAVELAQGLVSRAPADVTARLTLARAYVGLAMPEEALEQINTVLEKDPREVRAHILAADIYQMTGKMDKAAEHLSRIDAKNVDERTNPTLLASLKLRQKAYDEAADICNRALAAGIADPALRQILALVYLRQNNPAQAELNLMALVRLLPDNPQVYANLAAFYIDQKMADKGMAEFNALQTPENEPLARLAQATILANTGRAKEAIDRLQAVYLPLLRKADRRAMLIAQGLARIYIAGRDIKSASAAFDPMITADFLAVDARFQQVSLRALYEKPEEVLRQIDELSGRVGPDNVRVQAGLVRLLVQLRQFDRALRLADQMLAQQAGKPEAYRRKAEVLLAAGRAVQAVDTLKQAVAKWPEDDLLHRQLARAQELAYDFPAAEVALNAAAKIDAGARIAALADLGQMFVGLGLSEPAAATFERLEKEGQVHDPRVMLAMGRALHALKKDSMAAQRLADVPSYAREYASAQVLLAQIEQTTGKYDDARKRLESLMADPDTAALASVELVRLNIRSKQSEELLRWSDQKIVLETLPRDLQRLWLNIRVTMADMARQGDKLAQALDRLERLYPDNLQLQAARILTLIRNRNLEQARIALPKSEALRQSNYGPLLLAALGEKAAVPADFPAFDALLVHLSQGELDAARALLPRLLPSRTIYVSDLRLILDRPDAQARDFQAAMRQLALAQVANKCNLSQMALDYAQDVIKRYPTLLPAYAIAAQAQNDLEQPLDDTLASIRQAAPDSAVAQYLTAMDRAKAKDFAAAVQLLQTLLERNPGNPHLQYQLSQVLDRSGQADKAIAVLEQITVQAGSPYYGVALNDLAYLMAENQPQRLAQAYTLAQKAFEISGQLPALLDTLGWIEHLRGDNRAALGNLARALPTLNTVPEVHYHIGLVYRDLGNTAWARYHLTEAARADSPVAGKAKQALDNLK